MPKKDSEISNSLAVVAKMTGCHIKSLFVRYVNLVDAKCPRHICQLGKIGVVTPIDFKSEVLEWRHYTKTCADYDIYRLHQKGLDQPLEPIIDITFNPRERLSTFQSRNIVLSPRFQEDCGDMLPVENVVVYALIKPEIPKTR